MSISLSWIQSKVLGVKVSIYALSECILSPLKGLCVQSLEKSVLHR